ncbi:hypothetical protein L3X38_016623 [Prunus dulcis]|uniref:Disease resistance N-terminal domain-containing protein n=1 Tax=Prunus dulcis TaxID=3755 RepID=A0AAD4W8B3_PRUDU|nr:hypothetical protein L3X38_016623 [Prunus dulcis]
MAEALISVLLEQLASIIQKTSRTREERQMKKVDVRYWLDSLKDVSYEMDDVLDEWSTEILKQHIQKQEAGLAVGSFGKCLAARKCLPSAGKKAWLPWC